MKKIVMTKYGFVRWPEKDFSDDGNRFTCYRVGESTRVSKLVSDGRAYLSIESSCGKGTLPYEHYSTLPHYNKACWMYNGVVFPPEEYSSLRIFTIHRNAHTSTCKLFKYLQL